MRLPTTRSTVLPALLATLLAPAAFAQTAPPQRPEVATAPSNHSPKFKLDESSLDLGPRALLQVSLDYLHGAP